MIDRHTIDNGITLSTPVVSIRYQYDNHLGSASLELDQNAAIISYEEYHPFGTTSYRSGRTETEVALKRYKYVGKERDEETGLYYYGARYYAAWIARFVSVDPLQFDYSELTPYQYSSNRPITGLDIDGLEFYNPNEVRIKIIDNEIHVNIDNFHSVTKENWKRRDSTISSPNNDIGWPTKLEEVLFPGLPVNRELATLDNSYQPFVDPAANPSLIRKEGFKANNQIDRRVNGVIGTPKSKIKGLAGFTLILNAVNWGFDTFSSFSNLDDRNKVNEHLSTLHNTVFSIVQQAIEIGGYIPEKYQNCEDLLAISSVILSGVNPSNDIDIYNIGIHIVKDIAKNYKPILEIITLPISENADKTAVFKQFSVPKSNPETN